MACVCTSCSTLLWYFTMFFLLVLLFITSPLLFYVMPYDHGHMLPLSSKKGKIKEKEIENREKDDKIRIKYRNFEYFIQYHLKVFPEEKPGLSSTFSNFFPIFQVFSNFSLFYLYNIFAMYFPGNSLLLNSLLFLSSLIATWLFLLSSFHTLF